MTSKKTTKKISKKASKKTPISRNKSSVKTGPCATKKVVSRKKRSNPKKGNQTDSRFSLIKFFGIRLFLIALIVFIGFTAYLDIKVRKEFEGQKWALPAHVYTRPLEVYIGQRLNIKEIQSELIELGYQQRGSIDRVGSYSLSADRLAIHQREFRFWDGLQQQQQLTIDLDGNRINNIRVKIADQAVKDTEIVRLEPRLFGSVSPLSHEDRSLMLLENVPADLINGLIAIEDRSFYSHFGVNPFGIARAMLRNISAGRVVQGGSTLTQQLVKNYYLSSERTLKRKITELIMSVLLEVHYSKEQILQAYINEVYLSQVGNRAIHGFALGSQTFFGRPLHELDLSELATLAGLVKGPSYYNPIRHPERSQARRDLVLKAMLELDFIDKIQYQDAITKELHISHSANHAAPLSYPAFLGFIRDNLQNDYQQQDLLNDGLQIYTTLNPRIQESLEKTVYSELQAIEKRKKIKDGTLQVAAVVIRTDNGEVAAMVGDRKARFSGFNRAIKAQRPVGSLLKPFVYLSALESPENYSLASLIDDKEIVVKQAGSPDWRPQNYDKREHGQVMLIDALAHSYNLATVQLGMALGVPAVTNTIKRLGYAGPLRELPSLLLGSVPMSVMDVGQLYLALASGGFKTPIKGIRSVLSKDDEPLARYPLQIEQVIEPEVTNLINFALQEVVRSGTGRSVLNGFKYDYGLAGKTGTTDDYRDSWFAGYSGNYLTVVWVGRDDNQSTGLTGASGAAKVWARLMQQMPLERLELPYRPEINPTTVYYSLNREQQDCSLSRELPILDASLPLQDLPCAAKMKYDLDSESDDEQQHFEYKERQPDTKKRKKRQSFWQRIFG